MTMPAEIPSDPMTATPEWWLQVMVMGLLDRQPELYLRDAYVSGNQPLPDGDKRYVRVLRALQRKSRTNYCGLVTSSKVERMRVRGFRFGPVGKADPDAKAIWSANDMPLQSNLIHRRAAKYGLTYALATPPAEGKQWPGITAEDPRQCITYQDPTRPTRSIAGLKMWNDAITGRVHAVLFLPGVNFGFVGPESTVIADMSYEDMRDRLLSSTTGGLQLMGEQPTGLTELPMVQYIWRPDSSDFIPYGEAGPDVRDIQDRINQTMLDRLIITRAQAYKQRWASGLKIAQSRTGNTKPPFDPGADVLWVTEEKDAKFGEFGTADIRQLLEAVRDDVADIAAITKTPAHYLMGKMANVSGETLSEAETGLVSAVEDRMESVGWGHETLMKTCFRYLGNAQKAEELEAETLWTDPQRRTMQELADAAIKWSEIGIPLQLIMDRQGFSDDEIAFAVEERDRQLEKQVQLQARANETPTDPSAAPKGAASRDSGAPAQAAGGSAKSNTP